MSSIVLNLQERFWCKLYVSKRLFTVHFLRQALLVASAFTVPYLWQALLVASLISGKPYL